MGVEGWLCSIRPSDSFPSWSPCLPMPPSLCAPRIPCCPCTCRRAVYLRSYASLGIHPYPGLLALPVPIPLNPPAPACVRTLTPLQPVYLTEFGVPGADLGGIHYLRNVVDAEGLVAAAAATKEAGGQVRSGSGREAGNISMLRGQRQGDKAEQAGARLHVGGGDCCYQCCVAELCD